MGFNPLFRAAAHKTYASVLVDVDLQVDLAALIAAGLRIAAPRPLAYLVVGVSGDITIVTASGTTDTFFILAGTPVYIEAVKILVSGTTALKITAFW